VIFRSNFCDLPHRQIDLICVVHDCSKRITDAGQSRCLY